jgi:peptide chain release factor 1
MGIRKVDDLFAYLASLHEKGQQLTSQLSSPETLAQPKQLANISKELSRLKPVLSAYDTYQSILHRLHQAEEMLGTEEDPELREMAQEEFDASTVDLEELAERVKVLLVSDEVEDNRNVFLEIRAGAGGNEASLFVMDLLRMYQRICENRGWKFEEISTTASTIGGIKEIITAIRGQNVYGSLRYESGVHRVQRVPETEASGRIHTSTVTVAVMSEVEDVEIDINPKDLRIDTYRSTGAGGQHVNKTDSAIRITHLPTNLVVTCQDEKSQHKNRDRAMKLLQARLYDMEKERLDSEQASSRKAQVGSGERSEKIRTYNYPQSRLTDHRISQRNFNLETILDGQTEELFDTLKNHFTQIALQTRLEEILSQ